jgi:hypothetical protein
MQVAKVYDGVRETGPYFDVDRRRIADPAERERIVGFLRSGALVMRTTGRDTDRIEPERGRVVPLSFRTDGHWVWSDALGYYLDAHGVAPEPEFLQHIAAAGYRAEDPDEEARRQAVLAVSPAPQ